MENEMFEKIEQYLHHELKGEELRLFEEQLITDKELREQLALYKIIDDEMRQNMSGSEGEGKLKEILSGFNKKYFSYPYNFAKVLPFTKRRKWRFAAAAAAILFILAGAYWAFFSGEGGNKTLYAQYARHQSLSLQRGNNDSAKMLQDAIKAYNNKEFNDALTGLTNYLQSDSSDAELVLAKNICLTETGNYEQAIAGLSKLALEDEIFRYQALWYKALVYLKQDNKAECKRILASIPDGADTYTKAKKLLKEL